MTAVPTTAFHSVGIRMVPGATGPQTARMGTRRLTRTTVGIVAAGPAGLMVGHLLALAGIDSVALDVSSRPEIEQTQRAGIVEADSVALLVDTGVSGRVLTEGRQQAGIELGFGGAGRRIDFQKLVGASTWLYPQTEVFIDLADARERDGGDVRFGVRDVTVLDSGSDRPGVSFRDAAGVEQELRCDVLVGADGSRSVCRQAVPPAARRQFYREYPYAWFGILCDAPPSAPELIYNHSDEGFALISARTDAVQRMYFQCDPDEDPDHWSDQRIWDALQSRVGATVTPCARVRSPPSLCRRSAASCGSRCAAAGWCSPGTRRWCG